jgi:DNA processing protein
MQLAGNFDGNLPSRSWMTTSSANLRLGQQVDGCAGPLDARFPARLRDIASPPKTLWWRGSLPDPEARHIAIVGARAATRAACERARSMAADLGTRGFAIVSGGAFGIDAAAHEGALSVGAPTYALLGCGVDIVYPDRHVDLFNRITGCGGLLSEYPPGTPPRAGQFPARNRLIAGLADAVLVVEAASRSGALITARMALSQGRPLFAVPGSPGTDAFLRKGRALSVSSADALEAALASGTSAPAASDGVGDRQTGSALLDAIARGVNTAPALGHCLGMTLPSVLAMLAEAELDGCVARAAGNTYEVIGRAC